ncbi:DUF4278 domain-containing protein [Halotia branconii]|uniref:DUF4278 domain-containing protein n=1 Tax=Halotia branconii CENA392 TaxID=1539056 RepID=A0AAJ6NTS9_9CYAN|nr:DUF4278 domain-containing protein [Halotia branconii]WGV26599.1 DUF4278 domain-containing protein [Halotia branconii CENA392]
MQLTYRAASYELNYTDVKAATNSYIGCYRGAKFKVQPSTVTHQLKLPIELKYRGTSYTIWQ